MIVAPAAFLRSRASALTTRRPIQFTLICILLLFATRGFAQEITQPLPSGWAAATGQVVKLVTAPLRASAAPDFIAVNSDGNVYALDGERGVPLWTAYYAVSGDRAQRSTVRNHLFAPVFLKHRGMKAAVVVAYDKGVRAIDAVSGRELWRTTVAGRPSAATLASHNNARDARLYLIGENGHLLFALDSLTGQLQWQATLSEEAMGSPVILTNASQQQLLTPLEHGQVDVRNNNGTYLTSIKLGAEITTQPLIVQTSRGMILLIGLRSGLEAFNAATLEPLGRVALADNQYPSGTLHVVDLDADQSMEVVMVTKDRRVVVAGVTDGKVRWSTNVMSDVSAPAFADVDGDGKLDVIVSTREKFAVGLSGNNGAEIWSSGEQSPRASPAQPGSRLVAVTTSQNGRLIIAGNDQAVVGLRALEVGKTRGNQ